MSDNSIQQPIFFPPIKPSPKIKAHHNPLHHGPQIPEHDLDASLGVHPALDLPKNTKGKSHASRFSKPGKELANNELGKEKATGMGPQAGKKAAQFMTPQGHSTTGAAFTRSSKILFPSAAQAKIKSAFA
jgi:hypothetical protein